LEEGLGPPAAPAEGVDPGVDHEASGAPGVEANHADAVEIGLVEAHLLAEPLGVEGPALHEGGEAAVLAKCGERLELLRDRDLEVVSGNRLVHGEDARLVTRATLWLKH